MLLDARLGEGSPFHGLCLDPIDLCWKPCATVPTPRMVSRVVPLCYVEAGESPREDARQSAERRLQRVVRLLPRRLRGSTPARHLARGVQDAVARGPRVNIQKGKGGEAKPYQVDQVLAAYDKLMKEADNG